MPSTIYQNEKGQKGQSLVNYLKVASDAQLTGLHELQDLLSSTGSTIQRRVNFLQDDYNWALTEINAEVTELGRQLLEAQDGKFKGVSDELYRRVVESNWGNRTLLTRHNGLPAEMSQGKEAFKALQTVVDSHSSTIMGDTHILARCRSGHEDPPTAATAALRLVDILRQLKRGIDACAIPMNQAIRDGSLFRLRNSLVGSTKK